jgi:hypothetical protein
VVDNTLVIAYQKTIQILIKEKSSFGKAWLKKVDKNNNPINKFLPWNFALRESS